MKADLPKSEPYILKDWEAMDVYNLIQKSLQKKRKYILHDGPPYANGDIHIGHALNKTLKDIVVKFKTMLGYSSTYVPGWDCHGLPVEHQLFKELGITKYQISQIDFRRKAYDYAMKFVNIQKGQFKRLGVFGDWENPYLTLTPEYEEAIVRSFAELVKKKYIYRGLKPVNWCFRCETALAEAEVEYDNHVSPSVYVKFKLDERGDFLSDSFLVIWTTTPWTLIANVAVAVHPGFIYSYVETDKGRLIIAKDLLSQVLSQSSIDKYKIIKEVKGKHIEGLKYCHPFGLRKGYVVLADYVSKLEGTGLVHTAPGHGQEDYITGQKYKLDTVMPVDKKGNFDETTGEFNGMNVYDANKAIINKLKGLGLLLYEGQVQHSYPHCWRCKTPIIFRATEQWFMDIDRYGLRERLLEVVRKKINWIPSSGRERIASMIELRPDWCLSRQRYWGVPIPSVICTQCNNEFLLSRVINKFADIVAKEGTDAWFTKDIKQFLPRGLKCPACKCKGEQNFIKGTDILDVWFDSGVSHQAVLKRREELDFPCELYLEGSDQHRGWFQTSLIPSMAIDNKPPFRAVLTHGFVVDGKGQKMSKSQGNVISPQEVIEDYGAEILRMWVASSDYNEDVRISPQILARITEAYRKIRNTIRFILSNLFDFDPETDKVNYNNLRRIDKWVLFKTQQLLETVSKEYGDFQFHKAYKGIYNFCNEMLSMYYLDMIKGRLYIYATDSLDRRAAQTVIYEILNILVRIMAPIFVFTSEEIWQYMPKEKKDSSLTSVHLLSWPKRNHIFAQDDLVDSDKDIDSELKTIIESIPTVTKALEEKRCEGLIGSSFDAKIILLTNSEFRYTYLERLKQDLTEIFKVSQFEIKKKDILDEGIVNEAVEIAVVVQKADGLKCLRCWNYNLTVGRDSSHPSICERCLEIIRRNE